jgi:hypothetical protein
MSAADADPAAHTHTDENMCTHTHNADPADQAKNAQSTTLTNSQFVSQNFNPLSLTVPVITH